MQSIRNEEGSTGFERDCERIIAYCESIESSGVRTQIAGGVINYEEIVCSCFEKCKFHHLNVRLGGLNQTCVTPLFVIKEKKDDYFYISQSSILDMNFDRPLGFYNDTARFDDGLYEVARRMLLEI